MKAKKVILQYPPASSVWHLPAGISLLTSILRERGHDVTQRYGHIIGLEYVLKQQGNPEIDEALKIVRSPQSSIADWYHTRKIFEDVSKNVQTPDKFSIERNNVLYVSEHYDGSIEGLLRAIEQRDRSMWHSYFKDIELPLVRNIKPDVYGISIADERQLIQGITLAATVKDASPNTLVVVGGNFWSRVTSAFKHPLFAKVFDSCDAIVYREGFQPIETLVETLDPTQASSTIWRNKK